MAKKEEESEIEFLKKKVEELGKEIDKYGAKLIKKKESAPKKEKNKYAWVLVLLIIALIIVDVLSLIVYYKPDFSGLFKFNNSGPGSSSDSNGVSNSKCSDGTAAGSCSKTKPMYCYNGALVANAGICGCPSGYEKDFQTCVKNS